MDTLSLQKGDALFISRAQALTADNLKEYYDLLKTTLETHGLMNLPSRIYNMDKSGIPLDHKAPKIVAPKGMKKVHCRTSENKGQITIIACANAAGSVIPPMVIFEGKRLNFEWIKSEVPNTQYGMSERGWTDQKLFFLLDDGTVFGANSSSLPSYASCGWSFVALRARYH